MTKRTPSKKTRIVLLASLLSLWAVPGHAGLSDREKALWGASAQAPTTFALPTGQDAAVMARAASLIAGWAALDRYMAPMPMRTRTDTLIQTADPTALNLVGFKVLDTRTQGGSVISVDTSAFEGKAFQVSQQHRDAAKRAHLLAYLLEQFAGVPTADALPATHAAVAGDAPGSPFEPYLQRLRSQLTGGQFDAALGTLDSLRAAVANQARAAPPGGK